MQLDISNKISPKVDVSVLDTIARSCRYLTVLKLSDYRVNDPRTLLVLCGKRVAERSNISSPACNGTSTDEALVFPEEHSSDCGPRQATTNVCDICGRRKALITIPVGTGSVPVVDQPMELGTPPSPAQHVSVPSAHPVSLSSPVALLCQCAVDRNEQESLQPALEVTREEYENQRAGGRLTGDASGDEDLYENDAMLIALNVEDQSCEYGCLDLETLWLDNVNINDQVMAVLLKYLPRLRDLNLSDTDISNPWLLLDPICCTHLLELVELDIKSTALSRTALELIPKFHPDLHRLSISSTTLPPHTYANIGKLTGVADLELIGGQFYLCEPKEIFVKGIAPAIHGIGMHLRFLNLTYFAHIEFEVIPKCCPKLEYLDLSFTSITLECPCDSLGDCCPNLRSLNLAFCHTKASKAGDPAQSVSQSDALQNMIGQPLGLVDMNISGLAMSDDTLKNIFPQDVHLLQVLDLSRCSLVTVAGVEYVWSKCPSLHTIDLTYCREITVNDLNGFEKRCYDERPIFKQEGKLVWK